MTVDQAFEKIQALQVNALTRAAEVGLATVKPWIPKDRGTLRNTTRVEPGKESVDLVSGGNGSGAEEYAKYQYTTAKRHLQGSNGLEELRKLSPADMKKKLRGRTTGDKYSAAYDYAVDMNLLTKFPDGVRWFRILLKDATTQRKMAQVYARAL